MKGESKDPVLVILQLTGGNDYFNTVIPYTDSNYYDSRPVMAIPEEKVIRLDDEIGLHPSMGPVAELYRRGDVAIVHGVGYENSSRSHFRSMDIWHTCEPDRIGTEGWLGRAIREIDPDGENPVLGVNIGQGLPRALAAPGVSVASVADLETYGLMTHIEQTAVRTDMLDRFAKMYGPAIGTGRVRDYVARTGLDALRGADILKAAQEQYASNIEYGDDMIGNSLRDVAKIHLACLGTRVFYTQHGSFDTHAGQAPTHERLWAEVSGAIADFWDDLREHEADDNVVMLLFSEFGRRVHDNGGGTDHGAAGAAFAIGPKVKGGMYSVYPETRPEALDQGDLIPNLDFRGLYSTVLEDWLSVEAPPIVNGRFEKPEFLKTDGGRA